MKKLVRDYSRKLPRHNKNLLKALAKQANHHPQMIVRLSRFLVDQGGFEL